MDESYKSVPQKEFEAGLHAVMDLVDVMFEASNEKQTQQLKRLGQNIQAVAEGKIQSKGFSRGDDLPTEPVEPTTIDLINNFLRK